MTEQNSTAAAAAAPKEEKIVIKRHLNHEDFRTGSFYTEKKHPDIPGAMIVTYYDPKPYRYIAGTSKFYNAIAEHPGFLMTSITETRDSKGVFINQDLKIMSHHTAILEVIKK